MYIISNQGEAEVPGREPGASSHTRKRLSVFLCVSLYVSMCVCRVWVCVCVCFHLSVQGAAFEQSLNPCSPKCARPTTSLSVQRSGERSNPECPLDRLEVSGNLWVFPLLYGRKLTLKAKLESNLSHFSFKA